jgi:predicted transposase YbfD/YdcC
LKRLRVRALERALARWVAQAGAPGQACLDGKSLRASRSGPYPALHLLALYSERLGGVIAQMPVPPDQNEITLALKLLKETPLEGIVLSGDAVFTQKDICQQVTDRGGDYFLVVKQNQPSLKADIETAFAEPFSPLGEADVEAGSAHGAQRGQRARAAGEAAA